MLFNSYIFILVFLPVCIIGYFSINHLSGDKGAKFFLLAMSLLFYGYYEPSYLVIIVISIIFNFNISRIITMKQKLIQRKLILGMAVAANLGCLLYFKYFDFFLENINMAFHTEFAIRNIVLPLGISFFTFQQLSYVIDVYRGETLPYQFLDYALFVAFFPQLIAGPIVSHDEMIPQFQSEKKRQINWENLSRGCYGFVLGLAKKVLIADAFGNAANWGFSNIESLDATNAIICMLAYTMQIYFDFSGYCDMAVGIGKMLNIDLPQNFNSPYKALTITEFWQRWHMTMTRFFTKYVYIPMGGNRRGKTRTYINIMVVFLLSGLWHGAGWNFILWGCMHGIAFVVTRYWKNFFEKLHPALNWLITFSFINVTWVIFRADSLHDAIRFFNRIALMYFGGINSEVASAFKLPEFNKLMYNIAGGANLLGAYPYLLVALYFILAIVVCLGMENVYGKLGIFKPTVWNGIYTSILFFWAIFSMTTVSTFLYFNF